MGALGWGGSPVRGCTVLCCWKAWEEAESQRAIEPCLARPGGFCTSAALSYPGAAVACGLQLAMAASAHRGMQ